MNEPDHLRRVARGGALNLGGAAYEALVGVALVAAITNGFSREAAGAVFATTALFLIALSIVQMGTEVGLVRWLPTHVSTGQVRDVRPTLAWAAGPVAGVATLTAIICFALAPKLAPLLVQDGDETAVTGQIRVLALILPVAALYQVTLAATRGLRTMRPTVLVEAIGRNTVQLVAIVTVSAAGLGSVALVLAWSLPYVATVAAATIYLSVLLRRFVGRDPLADGMTDGAPDDLRGSAAAFWRFTAPRALATMTQVVLKRVDIVLVAAFVGAPEAAGYTAATRFVALGQLGVQALQQSLAPNLSALFAHRRLDHAQDVFRATTAWTVLMAWPVYLACAALAPQLLAFFGDGYADGAAVVSILSLTMLFATACGSVDTVLLMSGRSWVSLANAVVTVSVNLGLNIVFIPRMGILGAALAWAVAIVLRNVLALVQTKRLVGISPLGPEAIRASTSSLLCFGPALVLALLTPAGVVAVLAAMGGGLVVYPLLVLHGRRRLRLPELVGALRQHRGQRRPPDRSRDELDQIPVGVVGSSGS